ncbi:MAG: alpha/beta hydrolase family protein [Mycetocola sp.]
MRKKIFVWIAAVVTGLVLVVGGVTLAGNSWSFDEQVHDIPVADGGQLEATLATPQGGAVQGLVVMVHGDGAVNATQDGLYAPWFNGAAEAGWATLSWSKPGVGGSSGDWQSQTMADRAAEVSQVIDWAQRQDAIPTDRIVLWGASQAGWVLPAVVAERDDIDGVVAVGTAINWLRQGAYNREAELDIAGASAGERQEAEDISAQTNGLLEQGVSYEDYLASTSDPEPMDRSRWGFVSQNWRSDATEDLAAAAARPTRWHLMAGRQDANVDVAETASVYEDSVGSRFSVSWFDGVHSMARPLVEDSALVGTVVGIVWPRALLAPGVIDDYRQELDLIAAEA